MEKQYKQPFDFTITEELRDDYEKFLRDEITVPEIKKKYNISTYQRNKLFDIMYVEKVKKLAPIKY